MGRQTQAAFREVEIQLGHRCTNRCPFCVTAWRNEHGRPDEVPTAEVLRALGRARSRGAEAVTFVGGEPTIHRNFLPALEEAVRQGFSRITIFSNGVRCAQRGFVESIVELGKFTWRMSIQGGDEATHDAVTGRKGAFARLVKGLALLNELDQEITANVCVNRLNFRSLPLYPALVAKYNVRQLHLDMVRPADAGTRSDEELRRILVPYSEIAPAIRTMLELFEANDPGYDVNVGNFPYCLLPEWTQRIHHGGSSTITVGPGGEGDSLETWEKYHHQLQDSLHPPQCHDCVRRRDCRGVSETYARLFGTDDLQPMTEDTRSPQPMPQEPRPPEPEIPGGFERHTRPLVDRLLAAGAPRGWSLEEDHRSSTIPRQEIRYRDPDGRRIELLITLIPAAGEPAGWDDPLLGQHRFDITVRRVAGAAGSTNELARWAARLLGGSDGIELCSPVNRGG